MNTRGKREAKTAKREQETIDAALLIVLSSSPPNHIKFQPNRLSLSLSLHVGTSTCHRYSSSWKKRPLDPSQATQHCLPHALVAQCMC